MDLLITLEDLWAPGLGWVDQNPTKSAFIAQTSGGVVNALNSRVAISCLGKLGGGGGGGWCGGNAGGEGGAQWL